LPILLYIGLVIGAQAFTASPAKHAPAVMLAIIPNIAAWTQNQVDGALGAAGTNAGAVGAAPLANNGVIYSGMALLGGGAVLAGLILGAIAAFIIDREFNKAAIYALAGAVLAFFGFIHGIQLQWMASPQVALGYALLAVICYVVGMREGGMASMGSGGMSKSDEKK
jgi:AGZA family xanthine/uracil permease-like MFS transporter